MTGKKPAISVWLDDTEENYIKPFHCVVCGKVVFEYKNNTLLIVPGEMPNAVKRPRVVQCHGSITVNKDNQVITTRCRTKYWIE